ncbi:patatin-like phospholipase domain-containing protein 7 isoform X2 [Clavelina lepadiformis]|uniref:patatin-like phospholipase domain-containing protein 7 isoform X2 n=1 Tax=Clavelina lepadiformis TaxID=159417 RepID=UPI004040F86F
MDFLQQDITDIFSSWFTVGNTFFEFENSMAYWGLSFIAALLATFLTTSYFMKSRLRTPVIAVPEVEQNRKYRFRKRDKVQFYARKVLRKGKDTASKLQRQVSLIKNGVSVPEYSRSGRRLKNRERMMIFAKKVFSAKKGPSLLKKKELPSMLLEADRYDEGVPNLPEEVLYLLQSVKVFGHFEKGVFLQLCRHMETINLNQGDPLFEVGDEDKWLYVVQEGQVNLYITGDSSEVKLSEITAGESLQSLLSILDVLTGHPAPYKTVFARAVKKSIVIRLPAEAFCEAFKSRNESLVQIVQVIMTRMQRVTFLALHNYLGLSQELLKPTNRDADYRLSIRKLSSMSVLSEMAEKNNLSASKMAEQLGLEKSETSPSPLKSDSKDIESIHKTVSRTASQPVSINESKKVKQLRFNQFDTVVDDNDNVFHRQSSLPLERRTAMLESIRMARTETDRSPSEMSCHSDDSCQNVQMYELNEPEVLDLVTDDLCQVFGIDDHELLKENVTLLKVCKNYQLINEGDQDVSLYFVVIGDLKLSQTIHKVGYDEPTEAMLFVAKSGMLTGQLAVLTGEPSFFKVCAKSDSVVGRITRHNFYTMMRKYPHMILNTAHTVMIRISPFVRQIDFALDWMLIEAGKPLYRQGTISDCMYIVLHGRLRSVCTKKDNKKELVAEYGKGEIVGMNEALRGMPRPTSLHAVRDTELAKIPEGLVKHIRRQHPGVVTRLVTLMSEKLLGNMLSQRRTLQNRPADLLSHKATMAEETTFAYGDVSNHLANLSTVAILPASEDVPLTKFSMELHHSLTHICGQSVLRLSSQFVKKRLGNNALDSVHEYRLSNWLAHQEDMNQMVLYQTDSEMTTWTQRCIRQADAVVIVALGDGEPAVGELESELEAVAVRALKMLVLLHRPGIVRPTRTVEWLNMRGWLTDHTHVKGPKRLFARTRKSKMNEYWEKLIAKPVDRFSDFSRLARFLTGTSVALVLGGGGARGLSQIGILYSIISAGIPIDMIGGTSIGAFMGGLYAAHRNIDIMKEKTQILCDDMSSIMSKIFDLTYPFTSMFSGASFNKAMEMIFEDIQIEDLWIPYFTVTTDITSSEMRVHTDGLLWKYVRASMSYHPYLPPLCDPGDGHLLLDGCFVNNLPGDVARSRGACKVIAVDVGSQSEMDFTNYGDYLSGWWLLWKRLTGRWTGRVKVPDINDIQSRLSYISCHYLLERVMKADYCHYVRPPIAKYKTLEFHKFAELYELGYNHGQKTFTDEWTANFWKDLMPERGHRTSQVSGGKARGDISFCDLSEFVTQFDGNLDFKLLSDSEYELEYDSTPEFYGDRNIIRRMKSEPHDMHKMGSLTDTGEADGSDYDIMTRRSSDDIGRNPFAQRGTAFTRSDAVCDMLYSSDEEEDDSSSTSDDSYFV